MKTNFLIIIFAMALSGHFALGQQKVVKTSLKVYGNCGMCKQRIETVLDYKGIKQASWNSKTKELNVVFNSSKISETKIHELVASVGHDTDKLKAKDEVYSGLPFCCLYRDHDHTGIKGDPQHHE